MNLQVRTAASHQAIRFAADELTRCWSEFAAASPPGKFAIELRLLENDGRADPRDRYEIAIDDGGGFIAGINPRSVLFGVYRYLEMLGFRWVRPGRAGELVPAFPARLPAVKMSFEASYRHRGICIEGAISRENALDTVDWMARFGCNCYFIQFQNAFTFFDRYYQHTGNPEFTPETFTTADAERITAELRREITRRGLELHMVGHGWTCEPFGIPGPGWYKHGKPVAPEVSKYFAEVAGKRELWGDVALNTNLCYGTPEVREIITDAITEWAKKNPDVDVIHFWLADGTNNHCECPKCTPMRPADHYVRMLNELDEKLTGAGVRTRIVFLVYVDLLWPPETEAIKNPDRFILMFAPITRSYTKPFAAGDPVDGELPPYERNRLVFPKDPQKNLAFLRRWQAMFKGDSFDFDYHFMWDHDKDAGYYEMAKVLYEDCRNLAKIGLDGFVSCQAQRVFYPNGLGMTVMARTLWNRDLNFEEIAEDYFRSAYGLNWDRAQAYFALVSELFPAFLLRGEGDDEDRRQTIAGFDRLDALLDSIRPAIAAGLAQPEPCRRLSWRMIELHGAQLPLLAATLRAFWTDGREAAIEPARALIAWARKQEAELQPCFDLYEYLVTMNKVLGLFHKDFETL